MRRQPKARGTKAKYRVDAFYDLQDKAKGPGGDNKLELSVKTTRLRAAKSSNRTASASTSASNPIVKDFSYIFMQRDRLGIAGKNGAGKSTLPQHAHRQAASPTPARSTWAIPLPSATTPRTELVFQDTATRDRHREGDCRSGAHGQRTTVTASQFLQLFLFPPPVQYSPVSKLSGGEKRRLQLLESSLKTPTSSSSTNRPTTSTWIRSTCWKTSC